MKVYIAGLGPEHVASENVVFTVIDNSDGVFDLEVTWPGPPGMYDGAGTTMLVRPFPNGELAEDFANLLRIAFNMGSRHERAIAHHANRR